MDRKELGKLARDPNRRAEFIKEVPYMAWYEGIDFRKNPELYKIGRGEQGVLMAEPYKTEIGQHWRFRNPEIARISASKILNMFYDYVVLDDFVGADMARKYLMMGYTRARRYANHASGVKYDKNGKVLPLELDSATSPKAESARIFKAAYDEARTDSQYLEMKEDHKALNRQKQE